MKMMEKGTHAYELTAQPAHTLSQRMMEDLFAVARSEMQLARVEIAEKAVAGIQAGRSFGLAGIFAAVALVGLGAAAVIGLGAAMPLWLGALIVAALSGIIALALEASGRATIARAGGLLPARTLGRLSDESGFAPRTTPDAELRAESARVDLDRTVAALAQKNSGPAPMRDAILSEMAGTIGVVLQASKARR